MYRFLAAFFLGLTLAAQASEAMEPEEFMQKVKTGELEQSQAFEILQNDRELTMKIMGIDSSSLLDMARYGNEEKVRALLSAGANVFETNDEHMTPLMIAARYNGNAKVIRLLAEAEKRKKGKVSPEAMGFAVLYNNLEAVKTLAEAGAGLNARTSYGMTPLMIAALGKESVAVKWLTDHGADVNAKYLPDKYPDAYLFGNELVSGFLKEKLPASALSIAILHNQFNHKAEIAEVLASAGAQVSPDEYLMESNKGQVDLFAFLYPKNNPFRERLLKILQASGKYVETQNGNFNWKKE